ncbi:hypothetical protein [Legionella spiritensis]|uniref:Uncharacterized protein n=1 Tax=Legionella spiritensis TaxID=452 RepID=A0A0W0Z8W3_LEGSP|nr:hypothetical protein [Legionella spiritensis]KTD65222.1 hypothetical protein Lspi_0774 [Legionella spiritensis]SNV39674.1 Uncharacterised protein [Legionella spiritensis]VEG90397.1 Uncharacterised protein [Legionella spiritensis]
MDKQGVCEFKSLPVFLSSILFLITLCFSNQVNAGENRSELQRSVLQTAAPNQYAYYYGYGYRPRGYIYYGPRYRSRYYWTGGRVYYRHGLRCQRRCLVNRWNGVVVRCVRRCY